MIFSNATKRDDCGYSISSWWMSGFASTAVNDDADRRSLGGKHAQPMDPQFAGGCGLLRVRRLMSNSFLHFAPCIECRGTGSPGVTDVSV